MRSKRFRIIFVVLFFALLIYFFVQEARKILAITEVGQVDQLEPSDCGIVLTGGAGRIRESFEVLAQKKIKKLIISGVYKETQLHEIFPQLPFYPEITADDIILEKISGSTYGNAVQSLAVAQTLRCQNILLITSQLHMYRSNKLFRLIFPKNMRIKPYPVQHVNKDHSWLDIFIETIKSLFYSAFGHFI